MNKSVCIADLEIGSEFKFAAQPGRLYRVESRSGDVVYATCIRGPCSPFITTFGSFDKVDVAFCSTGNKMKRTLPSRTPQQVYDDMRNSKACWFDEHGEFGTATRICRLHRILGDGRESFTLRDLCFLFNQGHLTESEYRWIARRGNFIPSDFSGDISSMQDIENWECPKQLTLGELPNGKVRFKGYPDTGSIYTKVGVGSPRIITPTGEVYLVNPENQLFVEKANSLNYEPVN